MFGLSTIIQNKCCQLVASPHIYVLTCNLYSPYITSPAAGPAATSLQELSTHRTWDVSRHPQWLVFEVEGRLQIRPAQVVLANKLLAGAGADGRGPIAQLNMGEARHASYCP